MAEQNIKLSQLFRSNDISIDLNIEKLFVEKVEIYTHSETIKVVLISKTYDRTGLRKDNKSSGRKISEI